MRPGSRYGGVSGIGLFFGFWGFVGIMAFVYWRLVSCVVGVFDGAVFLVLFGL